MSGQQVRPRGIQKQLAIPIGLVIVLVALFLIKERGAAPALDFLDRHAAGITALATIIIAAFTGTLWVATSRQAALTQAALIADKRAFVAAVSFNQFWEIDPNTGLYNWRFRPGFQNSGETPTRDLTVYVACELRNTPLPTGFDFSQCSTKPGTGLIAPKSTMMGGAAPTFPSAALTPQDIQDAQAGTKYIYLWGWTRYFDIFPSTPRHVTRFCWLILAVGNPMTYAPGAVAPAPGSLTFSYVQHPEGNSADDEAPT
jgi:hypothetical protein